MMTHSVDDYLPIVGEAVINELYEIAKPLKGATVVHVNSTKEGGGVAEILMRMEPLMNSLGLKTLWEVIHGDADFYQCTKSFHNAIQGDDITIPKELLDHFKTVNGENAKKLKPVLSKADFAFIHDPQPAPLIDYFPDRKGKWVWRCHIDASHPDPKVWDFLQQWVAKYDASIFTLRDYAQKLPNPIYIVAPSIDPLSEKNIPLSQSEIDAVYPMFGIDRNRPMILQVSRFDRFKDPVGVIEAYRLVKKDHPDLQLVLAGGGATDDPEGDVVLQEVNRAANNDPDIKILLLPPDAHRIINALQRAADIVLQKSVKEGFGLTVTEALWKEKPVIGGNVGGIRLQIKNGETGFLVNTPQEASESIRFLLHHPDQRKRMGKQGKEWAREKFLITRHLKEYLGIMLALKGEPKVLLEEVK